MFTIIVSIIKSKYPSDNIKAYEPEIKLGDFTECHHCKKCFFNSSALHEHFDIKSYFWSRNDHSQQILN